MMRHRPEPTPGAILAWALVVLIAHPGPPLRAGEADGERGGAYDESHPLFILHENCLRCHSEEKRKGGLLLTSRESLLEGGDTGPAAIPGNCAQSTLVQALHRGADPHMPPKSQLAPGEIIAIEEWIDSGIPWDDLLWSRLRTRPRTRSVELAALPPAYQPVLALAFSPEAKVLAAARGTAIELYDLSDPAGPRLTRTLSAHRDAVQSLAWSPDGRTLASGGFRTVCFWDSSRPGEPTGVLTRDLTGRITALVFVANDSLVLADSTPGAPAHLRAIRLQNGKPGDEGGSQVLAAHEDSIFSLALSPSGSLLASASADKLVRIWDPQSLALKSTLEGHTGYVLACAFSPQSDRIATGGDDESVKVWRLATGDEVSAFAPAIASGPVTALAWTTDPDKAKKKETEKDKKKAAAIVTDRILAAYESGAPRLWTDLVEHEGGERSTGARERALEDPAQPIAALALNPETRAFFTGSPAGGLWAHDSGGKIVKCIERTPETGGSPAHP